MAAAKKKPKTDAAPGKSQASRSARGSNRKRLQPRGEKRGLEAADIRLESQTAELADLGAAISQSGGAPLGAYRDPFAGRPLLLASLPLEAVAATPFQRDLSPTHVKRLAEKIEEVGSFLDPLIVVRGGADGRFWTPNGRHRLAAAKVLGLRQIIALVSADEGLAFRILALNTEKAHNLKDKSLEVIRMARELARRQPQAKESEFAAEFEAAELLTLGILYEKDRRFAGGAYGPFLKKVDRFQNLGLARSLSEREGHASRLQEIDAEVKRLVDELKKRHFQSPYLRNLVVARINPVRFHRAGKADAKPPMPIASALTRMAVAAKTFDVSQIKPGDLALVAALSPED